MHKFITDTAKNRFFMYFKGHYTADAFQFAVDEALEEAKKLKPGYTVINDSSELNIHDIDGVKYLGRMMEFAKKHEAKCIIRLVKNKLPQTQLQDQAKKTDLKVKIVELSSVDEIEQYLELNNL